MLMKIISMPVLFIIHNPMTSAVYSLAIIGTVWIIGSCWRKLMAVRLRCECPFCRKRHEVGIRNVWRSTKRECW